MNKDYYKKAIDQIHPSDDLKQKTLEKMLNSKKKEHYIQYVAACVAMILIVCVVGQNNWKTDEFVEDEKIATQIKVEKIKNDLPRFESMQQLKEVLQESGAYRVTNAITKEAITDSVTNDDAVIFESAESKNEALATEKDFSTTNVQVENVDEADVVKTDGDYIYHVTDNKVLIIKSDTLEIVSTIDENVNAEENNERFSTREIFVNGDMLVVLGNNLQYQETKTRTTTITETAEVVMEDLAITDVARVRNTQVAKAIVYDISDRANPVIQREVELDGYYSNARMIGDYVYFISEKNAYYTSLMKDEEILPCYRDTAISQEKAIINYTDIAYFEGTNDYNFTLVAGFNIRNQEEISLETFLGASGTVYASQKNLYLAQVAYNQEYYRAEKSTIYKFNLENRTNHFAMQRRNKRGLEQSVLNGRI